jgi:hypothetical protein
MSAEDKLALEKILETMDVPPARKEDLGWLLRNLPFRNWQHPDFDIAMEIIARLKSQN